MLNNLYLRNNLKLDEFFPNFENDRAKRSFSKYKYIKKFFNKRFWIYFLKEKEDIEYFISNFVITLKQL